MTQGSAPERRRRTRPAPRTVLRQLADRLGIIPEYVDQTGRERRRTSDETRVALLHAMGYAASTEAEAKAALAELQQRDASRVLEPVRVVRADTRGLTKVSLRIPDSWPGSAHWRLELASEDGLTQRREGRGRRGREACIVAELPAQPGLGYHTIRATVESTAGTLEGEQLLILVPGSCPRAIDRLRGQRAWGISANLYTVRSRRNWGAGDLSDLSELARWTGSMGGAFVGVNPLHALRNAGGEISPYSPLSRLFRNPLYLDVELVPEFQTSSEARDLVQSGSFLRERDRLRGGARMQYDAVMLLKRPVLEALHREFRRGDDGTRRAEYQRFLERSGHLLDDFATFCALDDSLGDRQTRDWHRWPDEYCDPRSAAVAEFRERNADVVDYHRWVQFELERQLGVAAAAASSAGMPIGLYQDLAIGTSPTGSDAWAFQHLFANGMTIGAPPDPFQAKGQTWGLPPIDPWKLREDGYRYWSAIVRASLRHAGALRIDHVMGLFRLFWVPDGKTAEFGAYVQYPSEDLLGILALESTRANALVVGEDLGTVPPEVPPALRQWGILSSRVLYFEQNQERFRPPREYEREALSTANTHDLPTLAGFWSGRDIAIRQQLGLLNGRDARQARDARERERKDLLELLSTEGLLPDERDPGIEAVVAAVHALLRRTPSWLVALALDDLLGETEPVNMPGVPAERFPSWMRRLALPIDALSSNAAIRRSLGYERQWSNG